MAAVAKACGIRRWPRETSEQTPQMPLRDPSKRSHSSSILPAEAAGGLRAGLQPGRVRAMDPYPAYPPDYFPVPTGFAYAPGFWIGFQPPIVLASFGPFWGWGRVDWGRRDIAVDSGRWALASGGRAAFSGGVWVHNPAHRGGVPYADTATRARFNAARVSALTMAARRRRARIVGDRGGASWRRRARRRRERRGRPARRAFRRGGGNPRRWRCPVSQRSGVPWRAGLLMAVRRRASRARVSSMACQPAAHGAAASRAGPTLVFHGGPAFHGGSPHHRGGEPHVA